MTIKTNPSLPGIAVVVLLTMMPCADAARSNRWTAAEIAELRTMSISELEPLSPDPTNRVADNPRAVDFGRRLFFDTRLSSTGRVSCATCHDPDRDFQDGKPLANGVGTTNRRTMPIAGTAYSPFLFWDGRKDSQWAQALGPLESPVEHGGTRTQYAQIIAEYYRSEYEEIFGLMPYLSSSSRRDSVTEVFVNIGKAIAAYERRIQYGPSRFDFYVKGLIETGREPQNVLTDDEVAGLRLFIGKANCTQCHNGPLFTNYEFHNTGVPAVPTLPADRGRMAGATGVISDEFNCRSRWSDAATEHCKELDFMVVDSHELEHAFKTPSLRNVAERAPYLHAGQMATLTEVLAHYNRAPAAPSGHTEIKPLRLKSRELGQLEAFLRTLSGGTTDNWSYNGSVTGRR
jgi:cytochrome c peroxidase